MVRRLLLLLLSLFIAAACRPHPVGMTVLSVTLPSSVIHTSVAQLSTTVPTLVNLPSRTPTPRPSETTVPTQTATITSTPTLARTAMPINTPTPNGLQVDPSGTPLPTWTPPPPDPATQLDDHYRMRRPVEQGEGVNYVDRTYPYGSTQGGNHATHTGVEFVNPRGTVLRAVADGTVYYAGSDEVEQFGPFTNFYGRLLVIQHDFTTVDGQPVFSLYGHIERWDVETGARVTQGQPVALVGAQGIAQGPHLHFEVRVGDPHSYGATRNPELWIAPFGGYGTLSGRVTGPDGAILYEAPIQVRNANLARYAFTYADDSVNPDDVFGENFTLGDLPANYYEVSVTDGGRVRFRKWVYIYPNRTTWVDIQLDP